MGYGNMRRNSCCHIATSSSSSRLRSELAIQARPSSRRGLRVERGGGVRAGLIEETDKSLSDEVEALLLKEKVDLNVTNLGDNTRRVELESLFKRPWMPCGLS